MRSGSFAGVAQSPPPGTEKPLTQSLCIGTASFRATTTAARFAAALRPREREVASPALQIRVRAPPQNASSYGASGYCAASRSRALASSSNSICSSKRRMSASPALLMCPSGSRWLRCRKLRRFAAAVRASPTTAHAGPGRASRSCSGSTTRVLARTWRRTAETLRGSRRTRSASGSRAQASRTSCSTCRRASSRWAASRSGATAACPSRATGSRRAARSARPAATRAPGSPWLRRPWPHEVVLATAARCTGVAATSTACRSPAGRPRATA
jgi:hypothetical protein